MENLHTMKSRCLEYKKCQSEMFCFLRKGLSIFESIVSYSQQLIAPQKMYNSSKNAQNPPKSCYLRILAFLAEFYIFYGAIERHDLRECFIRRLNLFRKAEILHLVTFRNLKRLVLKKSQFQKSTFFPFFRGF